MIVAVSLRLLYLLFLQVLRLVLLLGRPSSAKDIELLVLRVCLGAGARVQLYGVGPGLMSVSPCRSCLSPRRGWGGGAGRCGSRRCC